MLGLGLTLWPNRGPAGTGGGGGGASYRYWRVFVADINGADNVSINEIEFRATVGGADLTTPPTPTLQSSFRDSSWGAANTVVNDLSITSAWISASLATTNQYVSYDLGSTKTVAQVAFYITSYVARAPKNFTVQGSSTGLTGPWTDVKEFANVTDWALATWKTFDL